MEYGKKINYPSWKKPGTYPTITRKELGLNNGDLEKFSLGNWNSIISSKRIFSTGDFTTYPNEKGRPVSIRLSSGRLIANGFNIARYNKDENGNIIRDSIVLLDDDDVNNLNDIDNIPPFDPDDLNTEGNPVLGGINLTGVLTLPAALQRRHFEVWGHYYTGANLQDGVWEDDRQLREERRLRFETTTAFIKPREPEEIEQNETGGVENPEDIAPLVFEFETGDDVGVTFERELTFVEFNNPAISNNRTHELFWPKALFVKSPTETFDRQTNILDRELKPIVSVPQISDSGFWEANIVDYIQRTGETQYTEFLSNLGAPLFAYNFFLDDEQFINNLIPPSELFLVTTETTSGNEPLYYDRDENLQNYNDTSYPLKVTLNIKLFDHPNFINEIVESEVQIDQLFYLSQQTDIDDILNQFSLIDDINKSYFTYQIIQWGDEKTLLTDEQIKNTYFFSMYDLEEYPGGDNYFLKKWFGSQAKETNQYNKYQIMFTIHLE